MPTGQDVVALAMKYVGYRYDTGPTRTTGQDGYFDCSGFTYFLVKHLGGGPADWQPQSHLQALSCRDHVTLTTFDHAIATPGALLFEGPDNAYIGGAGIPGHVAVSLGNGHNTVEAMGHAYGVCVGGVFGRGWSNYGLIPTYSYSGAGSNPVAPNAPSEDTEDVMAGLQSVTIKAAPFKRPFAALDCKARKLIAYNGGKILWHGGTSTASGTPPQYTIPGTEVLIGIEELNQAKDAAGNPVCEFVVYGFSGGEYLGQLHL